MDCLNYICGIINVGFKGIIMSNKDYKSNRKELQQNTGSLINNNEESGNILDDFDRNYEELGNVQDSKSNTFRYSADIRKTQSNTVSVKEAINFLKVSSFIIIIIFIIYLSYFYIGVNRIKNKRIVKKEHIFISGTSIDLQGLDDFSFKEHLQTANLDEINIAINKLNRRRKNLNGFSEGAKERIKDKRELETQLGFLQLQTKEVDKKIKMLKNKKADLEP